MKQKRQAVNKWFTFGIALAVLTGCGGENPFIPKDVAEKILNEKKPKSVEFAVASVNNDIYWIRNFDVKPKKITQSSGTTKRHVRLSHDHTKIAYLNNSQSPVIIDSVGKQTSALTAFTSVKQFDWSSDDKTLWMLIGNEFKFSGPAMTVPKMEIEPTESILSATITPQGDVLYIVRRPSGLGTFTERLEFISRSGSSKTINKQQGEIRKMETLRLSKDGKYFTLGYTAFFGDQALAKIEVYSLEKNFPEYTYETSEYIDAVFDFNTSYIVTAMAQFSSSFTMTALYTKNEATGPNLNKHITELVGNKGSIYVDWK